MGVGVGLLRSSGGKHACTEQQGARVGLMESAESVQERHTELGRRRSTACVLTMRTTTNPVLLRPLRLVTNHLAGQYSGGLRRIITALTDLVCYDRRHRCRVLAVVDLVAWRHESEASISWSGCIIESACLATA